MKRDPNLRERIVSAALDIIETQGLKALTQPRLAKTAGIRQSHLTYYYPRKADLFAALLEGSHHRAGNQTSERSEDVVDLLEKLISDPKRMRFFLGITLELSDEPELREMLASHARELTADVASYFDRLSTDPSVIAFIDQARGIGIRLLIDPAVDCNVDLRKLARDMGLQASSAN